MSPDPLTGLSAFSLYNRHSCHIVYMPCYHPEYSGCYCRALRNRNSREGIFGFLKVAIAPAHSTATRKDSVLARKDPAAVVVGWLMSGWWLVWAGWG